MYLKLYSLSLNQRYTPLLSSLLTHIMLHFHFFLLFFSRLNQAIYTQHDAIFSFDLFFSLSFNLNKKNISNMYCYEMKNNTK